MTSVMMRPIMNVGDLAGEIERFPEEDLAPIVRSVLNDDFAVVTPNWTATPLGSPSNGNGTLGLWRVEGEACVGRSRAEWAAIAKGLDREAPYLTGTNQHAWRELEAFQSGALSSINTGLKAVPLFGITEQPNGRNWLWLRDLSDGIAPPWNKPQFQITARHIGQFNGLWPQSNRPEGNGISTDGTTDKRTAMNDLWTSAFALLREKSDHEFIARFASQVSLDRILSFFDDLQLLNGATRDLPKSVAHNDCHARNLFPWQDSKGRDITYAIDWASVGLVAIGVDGGALVGGSMTWATPEAETVVEAEQAIFDECLSGLIDSGWSGERTHVRLAYISAIAASANLMVYMSSSLVSGTSRARRAAARIGVTVDEAVDQVASRMAMFAPLVDEGLSLAA